MTRFFALATFFFAVAISITGQPRPPQTSICNNETAAFEEIRLRTMASQTSLELLREYSKALDESYEATRQSAYAESVIDTASLVAGWPMGKGIQEYFKGKAKEKFTEKLVKAGFKSVDKALLKDPSLNGVLENLTSPIESISGLQYDLTKEYYKKLSKEMFGDVAGEAVTSVLDLMKFGLTAYKGMKRLEGIRALARSTNDQIIRLQTKHTAQLDIWDSANRALSLCNQRIALALPPDPNNRFWTDVMEYLGPNWKAPEVKQKSDAGSCTLAGTWSFIVPALGSSTFSIDSKGATRESGMGSSTGTTVLNGHTLTYTWTTVYGYDGNVVINLNESCTEGRGTVTWTKYPPSDKRGSSFPATLIRRN